MSTIVSTIRRRLSATVIRRPPLARRGARRAAHYTTGPGDCVRSAGVGPEWSNKPEIVASYAVIRRCEELCMVALLDMIPDEFCSLGIRQDLGHLGPIAVGAEISITARCVRARGRYSSWEVVVRDSHEIVGSGRMDFVAVHRPHYEARRLEPKRAALAVVHG